MHHGSKTFAILALLSAGCSPAGAGAPPATRADEVRNVILMIADGAGVAHWSAAEAAPGELAVAGMPVMGLVATRSANSRVTDSAAGATVYATGVRVQNRTIAMGPGCPQPSSRDTMTAELPGCEPLESWFEAARRAGKATGVVTTTSVVDATPSAFVAHSPSRYWADPIAAEFAAAGLDVLLGGGRRYFDGRARNDGRDLLAQMCARAACPADAGALERYVADDRPLVGLFAAEGLGPAGQRSPTLPTMVHVALARLARDADGFVALFESEGIDEAAHANQPLETITAEMLEFDEAVGVALRFARANPGTLLVVTADHETGGLSLPGAADSLSAAYATGAHTAALVPLFAYGPGAERFAGLQRNDDVGRRLVELAAP